MPLIGLAFVIARVQVNPNMAATMVIIEIKFNDDEKVVPIITPIPNINNI